MQDPAPLIMSMHISRLVHRPLPKFTHALRTHYNKHLRTYLHISRTAPFIPYPIVHPSTPLSCPHILLSLSLSLFLLRLFFLFFLVIRSMSHWQVLGMIYPPLDCGIHPFCQLILVFTWIAFSCYISLFLFHVYTNVISSQGISVMLPWWVILNMQMHSIGCIWPTDKWNVYRLHHSVSVSMRFTHLGAAIFLLVEQGSESA